MKKYIILACCLLLVLLGTANASLTTIGTATYSNWGYNLVYDDDGLTWFVYLTGTGTWANQMNWASELVNNIASYNFNDGLSVTWSGNWRLATKDELNSLYYDEFGFSNNQGPSIEQYEAFGFTGNWRYYLWSSTEFPYNNTRAYYYSMGQGFSQTYDKNTLIRTIAVRDG
ncbi:MAG: DUF1566 domain-containing protein [Desulfobacterales bacterium]